MMIRLTARGAVVLIVVSLTLGVLLASLFGQPALAGVFFLAGGATATWFVRKSDLLLVALSPPTLLCIVLIVVSAFTGSGGLMVSVAEGTALTLVGAAPWLFAGTALTLIIAAARGVRELAWPRRPTRAAAPAVGRRPAAKSLARPGAASSLARAGAASSLARADAASSLARPAGQKRDATRV